MKTCHQTSRNEYSVSHPDYLKTYTEVRCALCKSMMPYDLTEMSSHLMKAHNSELSLKEYFNRFVAQQNEFKVDSDTHEAMSMKFDNLDSSVEQKPKVKDEDMEKVYLNEEEIASDRDHTTSDAIVSEEHVEDATIRIVSTSSLQNEDSFQGSDSDVYSSSEVTYEFQTCSRPVAKVKEASKEQLETVENAPDDVSMWIDDVAPLLTDELENFHQCRLCQADLVGRGLTLKNINQHMVQSHEINIVQYWKVLFRPSNWLECCLFKCRLCNDFVTFNRPAIIAHITVAHRTTTSAYKRRFGTTISGRSKHECLICKTVLTHDGQSMKNHFRKHHKNTYRAEAYVTRLIETWGGSCSMSQTTPDTGNWVNTCALAKTDDFNRCCQLPCQMCSLGFSSLTAQERDAHLVSEHNINAIQYYRIFFDSDNWMACSLFSCQVCFGYETFKRDHFIKHLEKKHKMSPGHYSKNVNTMMTGRSKIECILCGSKLTHAHKSIKAHTNNAHHLSVELYKKEFLQAFGADRSMKQTPPHGKRARNMSVQEDATDESWPREAKVASDLENNCTFTCPYCKTILDSWHNLKLHCQVHHPFEAQLLRAEQLVLKQEFHSCRICKKKILQDLTLITEHASTSHNVKSLAKYVQREVKDVMSPKIHGERRKPTPTWYNGCQYRCNTCPATYFAFTSFRSHMLQRHNANVYPRDRSNHIFSKSWHTCHMCGKKILRESITIRAHLKKHHKLSMAEYERKFHVGKLWESSEPKAQKGTDSNQGHETGSKDVPFQNGPGPRWYDSNVHECYKCSKWTYNFRYLTKHMLERHGVKVTGKDRNKFVQLPEKTVSCQVCSFQMVAEYERVRKHLGTHGLKLADYVEKYSKHGQYINQPGHDMRSYSHTVMQEPPYNEGSSNSKRNVLASHCSNFGSMSSSVGQVPNRRMRLCRQNLETEAYASSTSSSESETPSENTEFLEKGSRVTRKRLRSTPSRATPSFNIRQGKENEASPGIAEAAQSPDVASPAATKAIFQTPSLECIYGKSFEYC